MFLHKLFFNIVINFNIKVNFEHILYCVTIYTKSYCLSLCTSAMLTYLTAESIFKKCKTDGKGKTENRKRNEDEARHRAFHKHWQVGRSWLKCDESEKYVVRGLSRILLKKPRDITSWITVIAHQTWELMVLKLTELPSCIFFRRVKMDCRNAEEKQHQQFVETEVTRWNNKAAWERRHCGRTKIRDRKRTGEIWYWDRSEARPGNGRHWDRERRGRKRRRVIWKYWI